MSNKFILDLTVRLTEALDYNYDVVNMDTVLAVISELEGATITKEQLETTRLAKHINQLRRRNKSNLLAIRAKNLLKKWREMFGITSQAQPECGGGGISSVIQQPTPAQPVSSTSHSQPTSPNTTTQLLAENFDNSLSSVGIDFSRTVTTIPTSTAGGGSVSNMGNANLKMYKKSQTAGSDVVSASSTGSRSNGALAKSSNRNTKYNSSPATIVNAMNSANKVQHPISFKNLITGFNTHNVLKQTNASQLSPKVMPSIHEANESKMFIINNDQNHSQPLSSTSRPQEVAKTSIVGVSSPRTHKSMKRKERNSPIMTYIEHSSSPIAFENLSHEQTTITTGQFSAPQHQSSRNQIVTSTIDLQDSNSNSNFASLRKTTTAAGTSSKINGGCATAISSSSSGNKKLRANKQRSSEREILESEHFEPTIDESSRIAFPISGIQEYLSLSNSSMSIFPAGSGLVGGSGTERFPSTANEENQPVDSSTERDKHDADLTFAGKFKVNSAGGIDVESSSNYYKGGGTVGIEAVGEENNMSVISTCVGGGGNGVTINIGNRGGSGTATTSTLGFHPFSRNSNESSSNSRTSQLDLIDVVNQDSQSVFAVDDLRQLHRQKQSSNEKPTPQDTKFSKDSFKHLYPSKEQNIKSRTLNSFAGSSKPSTPNSSVVPIVAVSNVTSPPVVEQKVPKRRGRKKGSKGVDSVLAQSAGLNSQFLMSPALGSNKKVKTTRELLYDIQSRKKGSSATSSPTLMNWFDPSRPESSCSEPSSHSPRTSDANSTNATMSIAARSTPEKNTSNNSIAVDELYDSDSDTNASEPSHENMKVHDVKKFEADVSTPITAMSSIEKQIKELMDMLPPVDKHKIEWETCEDVPCTCTLREIPPEVPITIDVKTENTLGLQENVDATKNEYEDEEPIISVSVIPLAPKQLSTKAAQLRSSPSPSLIIPHNYSHSAPVSCVTSPAVPPSSSKVETIHQAQPTKSIFDLDFDDDNDPLHLYMEAASKTKNGIIDYQNNSQDNSTLNKKFIGNENKSEFFEKDYNDGTEIQEEPTNQSQYEQKNRQNKMSNPSQQLSETSPTPQKSEHSDQQLIPVFMNFPTYEVIEDPQCKAKQRYEIQTNQITKFHINAFHNCYIPNVNGNWDHSIPANNIDDESLKLENDSLYANVVPKYGCLVKERIPKDLSYIKFTSNFKPNLNNKKSDKPPPLPFLGVANIHRRPQFHLHHYHKNLKKKKTTEPEKEKKINLKKEKKKTKVKVKKEISTFDKKIQKSDCVLLEVNKNDKNDMEDVSKAAINTMIKSSSNASEDFGTETDILESSKENVTNSCMILSKNSNLEDNDSERRHREFPLNNTTSLKEEKLNTQNVPHPELLDNDQTQKSLPIDGKQTKASLIRVNGEEQLLMNNNSIIKTDDDNAITCEKKIINNNHQVEMNVTEEVIASRRSSSCSNSSLKQNQNSINMKLRQHRLETLQMLEKQQKRKRKHLVHLKVDDCEYDTEKEMSVVGVEQSLKPKVLPLIKRIKLVNGNYAADSKCHTNNMTDSSCLDDDNDSDCYHVHSENNLITEEEDEDNDDFEQVVDDYDDEEDGDDDEEEVEDVCGDFHEVVTRDMTSSANGNNHIVLTIKKTPSKTNSPSSSSMSPATIVTQNVIANAKIPAPVDDISLFLDDEENNPKNKPEIGKLLEISPVKTLDLVTKSDFFAPETTTVAVYDLQLKKDDDTDHSNEDEINNDIISNDNNVNEQQIDNDNESAVYAGRTIPGESELIHETDKNANLDEMGDKDIKHDEQIKNKESVKQEILTRAGLCESIQLMKKNIRRIEMKKHLQEGIEQVRKLHRQLFFPYELHNTNGSKILEINSCTSDCTDPSDDATTGSSDSDTECTTSSSSGNGNLKSRVMRVKRKRRAKLPLSKRKFVSSGGGNPPSSSSSSSSSSFDSSSSASAFTSWTTSDDDDNADEKRKETIKAEVENKEMKVEEEIKLEDETKLPDLPSGNNFLLRSFNHIYISTEERQRQQKLTQVSQCYQRNENANSGYITLSGDDSKDEIVTRMPLQRQHNEGYLNYFDINPNYNAYGNQITSTTASGNTRSLRQQSVLSSSSTTTIEDTSIDVETVEQPSSEAVVLVEDDEENQNKAYTVIMSSIGVDVESINPTSHNNNRVNQENSVSSINKYNKNNNNTRTEQLETTLIETKTETEEHQNEEDNLVAHEEYRTGIRRVDEDVVDEDGNNCARIQQFKEWHEVLQLRSYNDELLTVLPYVVIE